jgi:hypothetical protein
VLLTLLANNLNPARARAAEGIVPVLVSEDTNYSAYRRDYSAGLMFQGIAAPQQQFLTWRIVPSVWPEAEPSYSRTDHQLYFQVARQAPVAFSPLGAFTVSYRLPEEEIAYSRADHQAFFLIARAAPVVTPVPVPQAVGGALPGWLGEELGRGMGPYKRPGQVFGEPDPVSPRISSRAVDAPQPLEVTFVKPVHYDLELVALVALEELSASPTDLLRGPLRLRIIQRKE